MAYCLCLNGTIFHKDLFFWVTSRGKRIQMAQDLPRGIAVPWSKQWVGTGVLTQLCDISLTVPPMKLRHWRGENNRILVLINRVCFDFTGMLIPWGKYANNLAKTRLLHALDHLSLLSKAGICRDLQMYNLTVYAASETEQRLGAERTVSIKTSVGQTWSESNSFALRSSSWVFAR